MSATEPRQQPFVSPASLARVGGDESASLPSAAASAGTGTSGTRPDATLADELRERDPVLLREGRWCEACGAPWISTLAERAAAGWSRWCDPCGAERTYHVTPPSTWRSGRCTCLLCQARSALAASRTWRPRRMVERPRTDRDAKVRPYIDENERRGAYA